MNIQITLLRKEIAQHFNYNKLLAFKGALIWVSYIIWFGRVKFTTKGEISNQSIQRYLLGEKIF